MLLFVPNVRQRQQADCLAACAAMVLNYLGEQVKYDRLLQLLDTTAEGTPFTNIERLHTLGLFAESDRYRDDLSILSIYLDLRLPIIVAVQTWALPHWEEVDTDHAVVVVGLDDENVYINDPAFAEAPQVVPIDRFLHAWTYRDYRYGIISLIEPG
ncbi:C39 family peptidase [Chloroflexi bacterium TSY]|nr:C39 family peptidase [Chloroflexi bacterium TSY]